MCVKSDWAVITVTLLLIDTRNKYHSSLEGLSQEAFELSRSIQFIPLGQIVLAAEFGPEGRPYW